MAFEQFVARDEELSALSACFDQTVADRFVLVAIGGEAGVGKSRLVQEFCRRVAGRTQRISIGRCRETIKTPFLPFTQVFRDMDLEPGFDIDRAEKPLPRGRDQKEKHVARLQQMTQVLLKATEAKSHVIVIEDLHWADAATLELLEHLAFSRERGRLLIIVTIRTEISGPSAVLSRALSRLRSAGLVFLGLKPLDPSQMTALLRFAAPGLIRPLVERIKRLSEGNPLFAEELLRAVLDGDSTLSHPAYSSIRATVVDRLYRLSEADQRILMCAAVVGRFFDVRFVAPLAGKDIDECIGALRRARNHRLIRECDNPGSPEVLAFRHAIFAEVIHGELLAIEARRLHAQLAEHVERQPDARRRVSEIAHHYAAAGNAKKALLYNVRAGDDAMRVTAFEDAANFYGEAIRYSKPGSPVFAKLAEKRAYAWYAAGVAENIGLLFSEAVAAYESLGMKEKVAEMLLFLSRQAWNDAEAADGYKHALRAAALFGKEDVALHDYATAMAATYAAHLGSLDEAEVLLEDLCDEQRPEIATRIVDTKAIIAARRGRLDDAWSLCLQVQDTATRSGDPDAMVRVYSNSADIAAARGHRQEAVSLWQIACKAAADGGYVGRMAYSALGYAAALLDCGRIDEARKQFDIAVATGVSNASVAIQATRVAALLRAFVGAPYSNLVDWKGALGTALRSRESLRIGQLASALAFSYLSEGLFDESRTVLGEAIDALESAAFAEFLLFLGVAHGDERARRKARTLLNTASSSTATFAGVCRSAAAACDAPTRTRRDALREALLACKRQDCVPLELSVLVLAGETRQASNVAAAIGATLYCERINKGQKRGKAALTPRELEVARLLAESMTNKGIADSLGISERTVEHHVESILSRLDLRSRWFVTPDLVVRLT